MIKKVCLLVIVALATPVFSFAQPDTQPGFMTVEKEPVLQNGQEFFSLVKYPKAAKKQKIQGQVVVKMLVDEGGKVSRHEIIDSPHELLTKAVEEHLADLRFQPAQAGGKSIPCWVQMPFVFTRKGLKKQ